jgi:asparagine synthase (glutamine-hydrolysing)
MCGICGFIHADRNRSVNRDALAAMNAALFHRGPDSGGEHVGEGAALAMRRLAIVDVAGGSQPLWNEDHTVGIVYNGEVFNGPELQRGLEARGHVFKTHSDTEAIVHLYEEKGPAVVDELRGMFAFAILDTRRGQVLLARDRLGKKPLYWALADRTLVFGSELVALREYPGLDWSLDEGALRAALALQYIPSPRTPYKGIHKLPAGHRLVFKDGVATVDRYWQLAGTPSTLSYDAAREELRARLEEAVRLRLLSEVPLGAMLSGGLDSSGIVALMSRLVREPVKTYSVRFDGENGATDARFAREVAAQFKCDHHELFVGEAEALTILDRVFGALDEPILDPACLPTFLVSKLARESVTVALAGEGGDELFAGYARYRLARMAAWPAAWLRPAVEAAAAAGMVSTRNAKGFWAATEREPALRHLYASAVYTPGGWNRLTGGALVDHAGPYRDAYAGYHGPDRLNATLAADMKTWLADDLLQKVDRMSMAVSLEARTPFLDHPLVEFADGLPGLYKLDGGVTKRILKDALQALLPAGLAARRKVGFEPPWGRWFQGPLRDRLHDALDAGAFRSLGWIDRREVDRLIARNDRTGACGLPLYGLLGMAEWAARFSHG